MTVEFANHYEIIIPQICQSSPSGYGCTGIAHTGDAVPFPIQHGQAALCYPINTQLDRDIVRHIMTKSTESKPEFAYGLRASIYPKRFRPIQSRCCQSAINIGQLASCSSDVPQQLLGERSYAFLGTIANLRQCAVMHFL